MCQSPPPEQEVRVRPDGFSLLRLGGLVFHLDWEEVVGVGAFRADPFGECTVSLAFRCADEERYLVVCEQALGFDDLALSLEQRFPEIGRDWWEKIAAPAPGSHWTVLWGSAPEAGLCPTCGYDLRASPARCPECGRERLAAPCGRCRGRGEYEWVRHPYLLGAAIPVLGIVSMAVWRVMPWVAVAVFGAIGPIVLLLSARSAGWTARLCRACAGTGRQKTS